MKKGLVVILLIFSFFLVNPIQVEAFTGSKISDTSLNYFNSGINFRIFILDRDQTDVSDVQDTIDTYNQDQSCTSDTSLLGNPNDPDSVAWLLQQILNYIRVIGPILVVILSGIEFAKVIIQSDDEAMGKAQKKLINRILLVVALFFVPTLVQVLLQIFGITGDPTCGLK